MIKAIILDFDGVIVDSEPIHMLTFQELLGPLGVKIEKKRWYREFVGTGSRTIMKRLFDEFNIKEDADAYVARRKQLFASYVEKGAVKPVNGIAEFLKIAREKNLKLAIASGSHKNSIVQLLKMFGLESFFDAVVGAEDTVRKKPDPEPFLTAAKKLNIPPSDCLVVEDGLPGMKAAEAAGMSVVMMRSAASSHLNNDVVIINDFSEFPFKVTDESVTTVRK
jgi:HAD superfamily hydrolase (TIGR01509 family)